MASSFNNNINNINNDFSIKVWSRSSWVYYFLVDVK